MYAFVDHSQAYFYLYFIWLSTVGIVYKGFSLRVWNDYFRFFIDKIAGS